MYDIVLAFITSFLLTFFAIPSIISVARKKELVDEPGDRRAHSVSTPSLGGIAIFAGTIFSIILWTPFRYFGDLQYILCACIIIFLIGAKDDIDPVSANRKILGQIFAACILIFFSKLRITSFYGIFGITELPILLSIAVTLFIIIIIINAFNLIDGVNGLAGSIGILMAVTFGTWFYMVERIELASISFALAGSVIAFLYYNITPAKIFMGDTGSLLVGLVASILSISFIEHHQFILDTPYARYAVESPPAIAVGILIIPLFDTLRVFTSRMLKGKSPFRPDRNHIHHLLLDIGYSHMQVTALLILVNLGFIFLVYKFQSLGSLILLLALLVIASLLVLVVQLIRANRNNKQKLKKTA